ncbi:MAG: hypothetical protein Q8O55_00780 [Dehalococcoidales bacterium]|nr:hypothetical protein [Dehalococcoidales bacterium]
MITTVTTVTTVTVMATLGLTVSVGIVAVIALLGFLTTRELGIAGQSTFASRIARFAGVGIVPLVMAFAVTLIVELSRLI